MRTVLFWLTSIVMISIIGLNHASANPPLLYVDPMFGPICAGPIGPGPCGDVERFLKIQRRAASITLPVVNVHPHLGPICNGPFGNGPCQQVVWVIASRQVAEDDFNLQRAGNLCIGPYGPAPCDVLAGYFMQAQIGAEPSQRIDPRSVQVVSNPRNGSGEVTCQGNLEQMPCTLAGQSSLDRMGVLPAPSSFQVPAGVTAPSQIAAHCAKIVKVDVAAFAACTGQKVVLPANQQAVLDCAAKSLQAEEFATCAAPELGIKVSTEQRKLIGCAMKASGEEESFRSCAGDLVGGALNQDQRGMLQCAADSDNNAETFTSCAAKRVFSQEQRAVVDCAINSEDAVSFASCAASNAGIKMSDEQRILARCAMQTDGDVEELLSCTGSAVLEGNLGPNEKAVLGCAVKSGGSSSKFASCSANKLLDGKLSREQEVAIQCAAEAQGDATLAATCAGTNMFNMQLNPEQQIAVQCVVSTGGQPHAAAGCIASRLTVRELTKCLTGRVGGDGCFGDSNDLVGRSGWIARNLRQIAGGKNSVINNPDQVWGGDNSYVKNPHQILGGSNSFARNPGQFWGGKNSIFNNRSQLLPEPRPLQLGSVAGKRICLPWC